ncbi:hypothetical protein CHCC20335_4204 [Bacillus paralicheniformis]|nr:hypothetical protein CHCC20335_4204 [Bacillus paralicheniformis]
MNRIALCYVYESCKTIMLCFSAGRLRVVFEKNLDCLV